MRAADVIIVGDNVGFMNDIFNHANIIKRIEDILKSKKPEKCKTYRRLDEIHEFIEDMEKNLEEEKHKYILNLPIDLICVEKKEYETEEDNEMRLFYTIFVVISIDRVSNSLAKMLEKRILFYKYHLSRIISTKRLKIILVAPYLINIEDDDFIKILKDNGIGLCKLFTEKHELNPEPKSIREQINFEFKERRIDKNDFRYKNLFETLCNKEIIKRDGQDPEFYFNDTIRCESQLKEHLKIIGTKDDEIEYVLDVWNDSLKDIPKFFERYIHDCIDIVGHSSEEFGESHLERKTMDKIFDLKKVLYRDILIKFINAHLTKRDDEYEFANNVFSTLWDRYIQIPYSEFLKRYEPALLHIFEERKYRDHYLHQFQVFLLGISIIDAFFEKNQKNIEWTEGSELIWLIVSSFHDMTYPIQLYDNWSEDFFKEMFKTEKKFGALELKSRFIEENFLSCMNHIIERLYDIHIKKLEKEQDAIGIKNKLVKHFFEKIAAEKNHGLLGGVALLKIVHNRKLCKKNRFEKYFVPSALAIFLHDIWSKDDKLRKDFLPHINFEDDPISFLLILCDSIQEWGRPSKSSKNKDIFYLEEFTIIPPDVNIIIRIRNNTDDGTVKNKQKELNDIKCFLLSSTVKFKITLQDKDGNSIGEYIIEDDNH